ncbi:MAG: oxidase [Caproiciproducens sp.]|nr:oxidase [Caproiciproducens sp.]
MQIFKSIRVKDVEFKNRVVMAPMVLFGLPSSEAGIMGEEILKHYLGKADTGIGLIICQAVSVTAKKMTSDGGDGLGRIGVYSDEHIRNIQKIAEACHNKGSKFFVQLAYPSIGYSNGDTINNLTETELEEIKNDFVRAAERCKKAGCDGIELHGAHNYFLNMMASPISNQREDQYGGDISGRLLLIKNIAEEIKQFADDHFIISYRMGWNDNLDIDIKTAQALEAMGIEMLHISSGIPNGRKLEIPEDFQFNAIVYTGTQIKKHVNVPVIVVNNIRTLRRGNDLLENHLCDFVAYGRPFLADTDFMAKSLENYDYEPCFYCKNCNWFENGKKCPAQIKANRHNLTQSQFVGEYLKRRSEQR